MTWIPQVCDLTLRLCGSKRTDSSVESSRYPEGVNWDLLLNGLLVLGAAMVLGAIAERLKQSAIVGFMLAGLLIGPNVSGLIADEQSIVGIAQLGVTLLMFTIGLEFSWSKLKRLGLTALGAGCMQIGVTLGVATLCVWLFGLGAAAGAAIGAAVAMSSTGVVMPALARAGDVDSTHGRFALGILLVQDAAVVPAILLIGALAGEGGLGDTIQQMLKSFAIVGGFIAFFALFNAYVLPLMVKFTQPTHNRDIPVLFAIIVALGAAWVANYFKLSPALGAFIAAIFIGESVIAPQLRGDIGSLKTIFVTLFFASIGMLADPVWILGNLPAVLIAVSLVLLVKPLIVYTTGLVFGLPHRSALAAGTCMGQVGVFSFVLAQLAHDKGVLDDQGLLFNTVVSVAIVTLFATPYLVEYAPRVGDMYEKLLRRMGLPKLRKTTEAGKAIELSGHVIVVGFGPAGRAVADRAYRGGTNVVVLDLNPSGVSAARQAGYRAYVGDASSPDLLKHANIKQAEALVITLPDHRLSVGVIVEAREQAPKLRIVARSRHHRYVELLEAAGANLVVDEEAHVGEALGETLRLESRYEGSRKEAEEDVLMETPAPVTSSTA
jgi:CPA2 family monovalent cation:H+ antiporter-2